LPIGRVIGVTLADPCDSRDTPQRRHQRHGNGFFTQLAYIRVDLLNNIAILPITDVETPPSFSIGDSSILLWWILARQTPPWPRFFLSIFWLEIINGKKIKFAAC
jgi:hypothetical protein